MSEPMMLGATKIPQSYLSLQPWLNYVNPNYSDDYKNYFGLVSDAVNGKINDAYSFLFDPAWAAKMNVDEVPQPTVNQMPTSDELVRMLSGQGYDPAIMAQMKASASEGVAGSGMTELSQAKRALEQAGIFGSPAGAAVQADVARRSGEQEQSALRDIDIKSAQEGLTNFRQGVGYQTQIGLNNMQEANRMALENANRMFAAMSSNLANQQQANMANFEANANKQMTQAKTSSDWYTQQGNLFNTQAGQRATQADVANQDWIKFMTQLEQDRQGRNQAADENRWQTAAGAYMGYNPYVF
jgi:hypothetical protein